MVPTSHYVVLSLLLFGIGAFGVVTRRNAIIVLMSLELMFNAANINLVAFSAQLSDVSGHIFAVFVIFRVMGKNYDAAVICGGFCGLGMGATPVAIANMSSVTRKHGASFKAFLVIPLVGAFFIDILNAGVIRGFLFLIVKFVGVPEMPTG